MDKIIVGLLVILVFLVIFSIWQFKIQSKTNMSFWLQREGSHLYANADADVLAEMMSPKRTEMQKQLHLVFQFFSAAYRQNQFKMVFNPEWNNIEKEFKFFINNKFGKKYWINHIAKYQSWPKDFIGYGNSLLQK